jgi:hypothetical protein
MEVVYLDVLELSLQTQLKAYFDGYFFFQQ